MQFSDPIKIECCLPDNNRYILICLALPMGSTINDLVNHLQVRPNSYIISIWSKRVDLDTELKTLDRVEFNLPLANNPRKRLLEIPIK